MSTINDWIAKNKPSLDVAQMKHDIEMNILGANQKYRHHFTAVNYKILSKIIQRNMSLDSNGAPTINALGLLMDMCEVFQRDNEYFKEDQFLKACGVTKE